MQPERFGVNSPAVVEEPTPPPPAAPPASASAAPPSVAPARSAGPSTHAPASGSLHESHGPLEGRAHAVLCFGIGCAILGLLQLPLAWVAHRRGNEPAAAASAPAESGAPPAIAAPPSARTELAIAPAAGEPKAIPIRIAHLASPELEVVEASVGKRTCAQALGALGVTAGDLARVVALPAPRQALERCAPSDRLAVATARGDHRLRALEIEAAPGAILRVRDRSLALPSGAEPSTVVGDADSSLTLVADGPDLVVESLTLPVTHRRHPAALVVDADLATSLTAAGLDPSLVEALDDAFAGRNDLPAPSRGSIFRLVADETWVGGRFDRYDELVAFEYRPREGATPVRLYHLRSGKRGQWFDGKGHQPIRAKYRMPLAFPRITSRFNPKRLHPVLKVVMPHNGCDFGAKPGTPVYAIGAGVVSFRGEAGPSGNLVTIQHEGGLESGYAHLSRFAPGIAPGTRVEARTLIGYVGTTGRSTGPHLHLSVKRRGIFIDPLSLKMDAFRVVPPGERGPFAARKAEADALLDAIALPKADPVTDAPRGTGESAPSEGESFEDDHPH